MKACFPDPGVHVLSARDADTMCRWADEEGWNPGLNDAATFRAADPDGFLGISLAGRLAGTISAVRYGDSYAFVGFFIVRPGLRGHRIGPALARSAIERIDGIPTGIDGVLENVGKYERIYGFRKAWSNVRYCLEHPGSGPVPAGLVPAAELDFLRILEFDSRFFPAAREAFLRPWLSQSGAHVLAAVDSSGALSGYGVIRPCSRGWKIGPLFASQPDVAEALFGGLCAKAGSGPVYLDVPEPNTAALGLVARQGMQPVFATARMFRGEPRPIAMQGIYGITSFELG